MWPQAVETESFREAIGGRTDLRAARRCGCSASRSPSIAETLRDGGGARSTGFEALEITTCLRRAEVEVVTRYEPDARRRLRGRWCALIAERHGRELFSDDGSRDGRPGGAAACGTAGRRRRSRAPRGLLAARLTERPGSSDVRRGRRGGLLQRGQGGAARRGPGADRAPRRGVGAEVAEAMAEGALTRFEADTAVAITGMAGPDGGTEEKPVGTVCWSVRAGGRVAGSRATCGCRATGPTSATARPRSAMHLLRRVLRGEGSEPERSAGAACSWRSTCRRRRGPRSPPGATRSSPAASDLRPVPPEALHVTLVFLGWQDESAAPTDRRRGLRRAAGWSAAAAARPGSAAAAAARPAPVRARPGGRGRARRGAAGGRVGMRSRRAAGIAPRSVPSGRTSRSRG